MDALGEAWRSDSLLQAKPPEDLGRGVNKARDPSVADRNEHVDKASDVRFMTCQRIFDRARHRAQGRVIEHEVHHYAARRRSAGARIAKSDLKQNFPRFRNAGNVAARQPHWVAVAAQAVKRREIAFF